MSKLTCPEISPQFLQKLDELVAEELANSKHRDYPVVLATALVRRASGVVSDFGGNASQASLREGLAVGDETLAISEKVFANVKAQAS